MIIRQYTEVAWDNKTQTRRIVKDGDRLSGSGFAVLRNEREYVAIGKTYPVIPKMYHPTIIYNPDHPCYGVDIIEPFSAEYSDAREGDWNHEGQGYKKLYIRITGIRQERLRDITEEDAAREGLVLAQEDIYNVDKLWCPAGKHWTSVLPGQHFETARAGYEALWNSINTKRGTRFADNPLVWCIDFERVR